MGAQLNINGIALGAIICLTVSGAFAYGIKRNKVKADLDNMDVFASMICAFLVGIYLVYLLIEAFIRNFK